MDTMLHIQMVHCTAPVIVSQASSSLEQSARRAHYVVPENSRSVPVLTQHLRCVQVVQNCNTAKERSERYQDHERLQRAKIDKVEKVD